ncbi:MAG TPA: hypothetical protein VI197_07575, partial [Polyangiaceae bacterium]
MSKSPDSDPSPQPPTAGADEPAPEPSTSAKKARKRRRIPRQAAPEQLDQLDANGRERPRFLLAFPDDPELAKLSRAFEAGNYAYVREHASEVAARAEDAEVRRAALELAERIKPDPLIKYLLM